nr:hypothetical protein Iba_chr01fCG1660 [Ipomoea batatas]
MPIFVRRSNGLKAIAHPLTINDVLVLVTPFLQFPMESPRTLFFIKSQRYSLAPTNIKSRDFYVGAILTIPCQCYRTLLQTCKNISSGTLYGIQLWKA